MPTTRRHNHHSVAMTGVISAQSSAPISKAHLSLSLCTCKCELSHRARLMAHKGQRQAFLAADAEGGRRWRRSYWRRRARYGVWAGHEQPGRRCAPCCRAQRRCSPAKQMRQISPVILRDGASRTAEQKGGGGFVGWCMSVMVVMLYGRNVGGRCHVLRKLRDAHLGAI